MWYRKYALRNRGSNVADVKIKEVLSFRSRRLLRTGGRTLVTINAVITVAAIMTNVTVRTVVAVPRK